MTNSIKSNIKLSISTKVRLFIKNQSFLMKILRGPKLPNRHPFGRFAPHFRALFDAKRFIKFWNINEWTIHT